MHLRIIPFSSLRHGTWNQHSRTSSGAVLSTPQQLHCARVSSESKLRCAKLNMKDGIHECFMSRIYAVTKYDIRKYMTRISRGTRSYRIHSRQRRGSSHGLTYRAAPRRDAAQGIPYSRGSPWFDYRDNRVEDNLIHIIGDTKIRT